MVLKVYIHIYRHTFSGFGLILGVRELSELVIYPCTFFFGK